MALKQGDVWTGEVVQSIMDSKTIIGSGMLRYKDALLVSPPCLAHIV